MQALNVTKLPMITNVNELDRRAIIDNILYKIDLGRSNILPLSTYQVVIVNRRTIVMDITNSQLLKFCAPQQQMLGLNMEISTEA
jgi:hypothetical protein